MRWTLAVMFLFFVAVAGVKTPDWRSPAKPPVEVVKVRVVR